MSKMIVILAVGAITAVVLWAGMEIAFPSLPTYGRLAIIGAFTATIGYWIGVAMVTDDVRRAFRR